MFLMFLNTLKTLKTIKRLQGPRLQGPVILECKNIKIRVIFWDCLSKSRGLVVFNVFNVFKYLKTLKPIKNKGSFSGGLLFLMFLDI